MTELICNDITRQLVPFPEKVGHLKVVFGLYHRTPEIYHDGMLSLPFATNEVISLQAGKQIIIKVGPIYPAQHQRFDETGPIRFFLAGIDDNPFVTSINRRTYWAYQRQGEAAFYESLKPAVIKRLESTGSSITRRQGDIWAVRVGDYWQNPGSRTVCTIRPGNSKTRIAHGEWLFGSRHSLHGEMQQPVFVAHASQPEQTVLPGYKSRGLTAFLGTGVIKAPDHPSLDISDGIYAIARTSRPRNFNPGLD